MSEEIIRIKGKPKLSEIDSSFYSDTHDVPVLYIGGQIVATGHGQKQARWVAEKDEEHLRWKLDMDKEYEVIIREVSEEG